MTRPTDSLRSGATGVLNLSGDADASMEASMWMEAMLLAADASTDLIDRAVLAVAEAVANAVEHGHPPIRVQVSLASGTWTVTVGEDGPGPSPEALAAAALPRDATATHGRGLYLIATLADAVHVDDGRLRLTFGSPPS